MVKITENSTGINRQNHPVKSKSVNKKTDSKSSIHKTQIGQEFLSASKDTVQLSSTQVIKSEQNLNIEKYQNLLDNYSESKLKTLNEYFHKQESGYYNQEEIIKKTSETILNHPGFYKNISKEKLPISDNLNRIKNNIKNGYYNSDKVLENLADKLVNSVITPLER